MIGAKAKGRKSKYTYDQKVAICADYLIGMSYTELEQKHGKIVGVVRYWIRKRKCFKLRNRCLTN